MASIPANSSDWNREHAGDREHQLNQIIADYLEAHEAGQATDRDALLKQYPGLAAELSLFFANQDHVAQLTAPFRDANQPKFYGAADPALIPFPALSPDDPEQGDRQASSEKCIRYFGDY